MVILLGLIFLLDRSTQDQTMKISFIFFLSIIPFNMHLQSSSKFLELLKSAGKRVLTSRDTCRTWRVPGGCPGVGSRGTWRTRTVSGGSLSASTRDTWQTRMASGGS